MSITLHHNEPEDKVGDLIMDHLSRGGVDHVTLEYIRFDEEDHFAIKASNGMKVIISAKPQSNRQVHFNVYFT